MLLLLLASPQVADELGYGTDAVVNIIGLSNQNDPIFDANGDREDGIDYATTFTEGEDRAVLVVGSRAFIEDPDIGAMVESVVVSLTNPQLNPALEFLDLVQAPPPSLLVGGRGTAELVISSAGGASVSDFRTVLFSILYTNVAEEPVQETRIITFTISDGDRQNSPLTRTVINVTTINDRPELDLSPGDNTTNDIGAEYREASPALVLAPALLLRDPDNPNMAAATITLEEAFDRSNESIFLDPARLPEGVTCTTPTCMGVESCPSGETRCSLVLGVAGPAPLAGYQELLRSLRYVNLQQPQDLPNLRNRRVTLQVSDEEGVASVPVLVDINFEPINPRVIIQLDVPNQNYTTSFQEAQLAPIPVVGTVRIVDTSLDTLQSIVVSVRANLPGGVQEPLESIQLTSLEGLSPIAVEINTVLKRITFSQEAATDTYVEAIRRVTYFNGESGPIPINRFVDFLVIPGGGAPNDSAHADISLEIINDAPLCEPAAAQITVPEDHALLVPITTFEATDIDQGIAGELSYILTEGDPAIFSVTASGELQLLAPLDFEGVRAHSVGVAARDGGQPQLNCSFSLNVSVSDANDEQPTFALPLEAEVEENRPASPLLLLNISDTDSGTNAELGTIAIVSYSPEEACMGRFSVALDPPAISTGGLNFEASPQCSLVVEVTDRGSPSLTGSATVIVRVLDVDDLAPVFLLNSYLFSVSEDNPFPINLGQVTASDADSPAVFYSLSGADPTEFEIDEVTGNMSILFSTNYTLATNHSLVAVATDRANNTGSASVTVAVRAVNNDPPSLDLNATDTTTINAGASATFVEGGPPVLIPIDPLITDPDPSTVTLEITRIQVRIANGNNEALEDLSLLPSSSSSAAAVSVSPAHLVVQPLDPSDPAQVSLLLRSVLYRSREDEFTACASAAHPCPRGPLSRTLLFSINDGVHSSAEVAAEVILQPVNDAPLLDLDAATPGTGTSAPYVEGAGPESVVRSGNVSISDADSSTLISLTCVLANHPDGPEESLLLAQPVPPPFSASISPDGYTVSLSGEAPLAQYASAFSLVQYQSSTLAPDPAPRSILCSVSDGLLSSVEAEALLTFSTINQLPTLDLDGTAPGNGFAVSFVEEAGAVALSRQTVLADVDSVAMTGLNATLLGGVGLGEELAVTGLTPPLSASFVYPSLLVTGRAPIADYEALIAMVTYNNSLTEIADSSPRSVVFRITDEEGGESAEVVATVTIVPVDDQAPYFVPSADYQFVVEENATPTTLVGLLHLRDDDLPAGEHAADFRIVTSEPATGTSDFSVGSNGSAPLVGELRVLGAIDFEAGPLFQTYLLLISAQLGRFSANATVTIAVVNLPDLPPEFTVFHEQLFVMEGQSNGSLLQPQPPAFTATDQDLLETVLFALSPVPPGAALRLAIGPSSGEVTVAGSIDREDPSTGTSFTVQVTASDSHSSVFRDAQVVVLPVNEHPPEFSQSVYTAELLEEAPPTGVPLLTVAAMDRDEAPDAASPNFTSRVSFSLLAGPGSELFSLDASSGELRQLAPIDFEAQFRSVLLRVQASDNDATPTPLLAEAQVNISVVNLNIEPPFFVDFQTLVSVSELISSRTLVHRILFGDVDPGADLAVALLAPPPPGFSLEPSGELFAEPPLDADTLPNSFLLTVQLTDRASDTTLTNDTSITANFTLAVADSNDLTPVFSQSMYRVSVLENGQPGAILQVNATDGDYGFTPLGAPNGNNELVFSLGADAPSSVFDISPQSGVISTLVPLDRESRSSYQFTVVVRDRPGNGPGNTVTASMVVDVADVNEHPPQADPTHYFLSVSEATLPGTMLETQAAVQWGTQSEGEGGGGGGGGGGGRGLHAWGELAPCSKPGGGGGGVSTPWGGGGGGVAGSSTI